MNNDDDCVCTCLDSSLPFKDHSRSTVDAPAFKPNSTNILVQNMWCNGSHGISVGSLGQYATEMDIVANVSVKNVTMLNAQNGARIKVFGGNPDPRMLFSCHIMR